MVSIVVKTAAIGGRSPDRLPPTDFRGARVFTSDSSLFGASRAIRLINVHGGFGNG